MKFHHKLMVVCLVTIVIPITVVSYVFFNQANQLVDKQVGDSYRKVLEQLNTTVSFNLKFYESIADQLTLSEVVQDAFEDPDAYVQKGIFMMNKEIKTTIRYIFAYRASDISSIQFFSLKSGKLSDGLYWLPIQSLFDSVDASYLQDSDVWMLQYDEKNGKYNYALIKPIYSLKSFQKLGYLRMVIELSSIIPTPADARSGTAPDQVFILGNQGTYMYHSSSEAYMGQPAPQEIVRLSQREGDAGNELAVTLDKKNYSLWYKSVGENQLTSFLLVPQSSLNGSAIQLRNILLLVGGISMVVFTVLSFLFTQRLTLRLRLLHQRVLLVGKGVTYRQSVERRNDEIGVISTSFDAMLSQLDQQIQENFVKKLKIKELELNFLQTQINPHFLYNTLDSIKNEIELDEGDTAVRMVIILSDLFRISVSKGNRVIAWQDEIHHAECYLEIHRIRFGECFEVVWEIDPRLYGMYTLKIILQPILENAIRHGLGSRGKGGVIRVKGNVIDRNVEITITDNGSGIPEAQLLRIRAGISYHGADSGIGLKNINNRIQMYFGQAYGLSLTSTVGKGTEVRLYLPLLKEDSDVQAASG